jgi:uncharacterized tellurite resistance protein B-like protein
MLNSFLRRLTTTPPVETGMSGRLAMAALLVRLARADGDYAADEAAEIDAILAARYGLGNMEAAALRADAETLEADAADTVRFTRALKAAVPHEDREGVLEALWSLVLVDEKRDENEDQIMRLCADLLGVNDRDSNLARQRAAAKA